METVCLCSVSNTNLVLFYPTKTGVSFLKILAYKNLLSNISVQQEA